MTKMLHIDYDENTRIISEARDDDPWDRNSTRTTYTPHTAYLTDKGDCPISDCKVGDKVYVVWADYTTGDTFGSDSAIEFLGAFKDRTFAELCVNRASAADNSWDFHVVLDNGEQYDIRIPWLGYFESLGEIHIEEMEVKEYPYDRT